MSVLGNRVLRLEDERMLTEGARYVADLRFDGLAHACFVRSTVARGRLVGVDTEEAQTHPGVLGVFTAADLDLPDLKPIPMVNQSMTRPILARDTVRFVGEPVVAVVAETAAAAADAAEHVVVDIEPQPAVVALPYAATGNTLVHQHAATNIAFDMPVMVHTTDDGPAAEPGANTNIGSDMPANDHSRAQMDFSGCEVVVEASLVNQRLAAVPLEPRSAAAEWSADGTRLTFYASTQAPHRVTGRPGRPLRARQGRGARDRPRRGRRFRGQGRAVARGIGSGRARPGRRASGGVDRVPGREPHLVGARPGPEPAPPLGRNPRRPHHPL